ncbi:hypothetical protein [Carboxylicivirga taeanensis]|uniref:hypothetical protein n=1 Tax=Carboxylicivirga taeanensis TaxID=1416875 RepID=UPI003F6E1CCA
MRSKGYLLIALLLCSTTLFSQNLSQWAEKLNASETILDPNNKRFVLQELNSQLQAVWKSDAELNELIRHTDNLHVSKSTDNKIVVAAFGATTYNGVYQLEWLVNYRNTTWSFSDEVNVPANKGNNVLSLEFTNQGEDIYGVLIKYGKKVLVNAEDIITKCLFEELLQQTDDARKDSVNQVLQRRLQRLWSDKNFFQNDFAQLKRMRTLHSDDGKVKVCTYNIPKDNFKQEFYGAVIVKEDDINVLPLTDASEKIRSPERAVLSNKKWYGALYLDLVETKSDDKTFYTLIGYKGHDEFIKTRVLDVLTIQSGRARFGAPVFKIDRFSRNRVIFEYSAKTTMMLRYDANEKLIVFDNLAPADPMFAGVSQYYGPDFSYNAFKFNKGVWVLKKDIDLRNPKK